MFFVLIFLTGIKFWHRRQNITEVSI